MYVLLRFEMRVSGCWDIVSYLMLMKSWRRLVICLMCGSVLKIFMLNRVLIVLIRLICEGVFVGGVCIFSVSRVMMVFGLVMIILISLRLNILWCGCVVMVVCFWLLCCVCWVRFWWSLCVILLIFLIGRMCNIIGLKWKMFLKFGDG